jgi:ribosomal protein L1
VKLAIDPKKSEQSIRGSLSLPKGIGKARRVIVFADGAEAQMATESGRDAVGMDDLADEDQRRLAGVRRRDRDAPARCASSRSSARCSARRA